MWTAETFELWANGERVDSRANPYGFIPYVIFPNIREPKQFWGQSDLAPIKEPVQVFYQFANEQRGGLGLPMPAGTVRVYQEDSKGGVQFAGEDRIGHTPKDETLNVRIGSAFDVVSERNQIDFEKIAGSTYEVEYEISLRNHKAVPVAVEVNEPIGGTWRMIRSSHEWTKTAAWAARFQVPVAAEGSAVLKYRVRVTY